MINYGVGRVRFSRKRSGRIPWTNFIPLIVVGIVVLSMMSSLLTGSRLFTLPWSGYLCMVIGVGVWEACRRGKGTLAPLVAAAIVTTHFGLAAGQMKGLVEWTAHRR